MKIKSVNLLVNDYCNNKCKSCKIWENVCKINFPIEDICALFSHEEFSEVDEVSMSGGEALMREDIELVVNTIITKNPHLKMLFLNTNGTYPKRAENIIKNFADRVPEFYVCVSIEGNPELNNYLRGVKTFNLACETLEKISSLQKNNVRTIISTTMQAENATIDNIDYLLDLAEETNSGFKFRFASVSATYYQNANDSLSCVDDKTKISLLEHVLKHKPNDVFLKMQKEYVATGKTQIMQDEEGKIICLAGSIFCFVKADGLIYPCLYSTRSIGTAKTGMIKPFHRLGQYEPCPCFTECYVYPMINYGPKTQSAERSK